MRLLACFCFTVAVALVSPPWQCRAADQGATLERALGSPDPLYKFSPGALGAAVKLCAANDPGHAGAYVALVLHSGRNDADAIAPSLVRAAIQGLGEDPASGDAGAIVRAAVKSAPSEVLDIVTAAVKASPRYAAPAIVTAAISSVPHPESMVTVNFQRRAERIAGSGNDKQLDWKSLPAEQKQVTLAEAIVQAALDADPTLSGPGLTAAADTALTATFAPNRPAVLTDVLPPVPPLPITPPGNGFQLPGVVSP